MMIKWLQHGTTFSSICSLSYVKNSVAKNVNVPKSKEKPRVCAHHVSKLIVMRAFPFLVKVFVAIYTTAQFITKNVLLFHSNFAAFPKFSVSGFLHFKCFLNTVTPSLSVYFAVLLEQGWLNTLWAVDRCVRGSCWDNKVCKFTMWTFRRL